MNLSTTYRELTLVASDIILICVAYSFVLFWRRSRAEFKFYIRKRVFYCL
jgi:hypothetical protein